MDGEPNPCRPELGKGILWSPTGLGALPGSHLFSYFWECPLRADICDKMSQLYCFEGCGERRDVEMTKELGNFSENVSATRSHICGGGGHIKDLQFLFYILLYCFNRFTIYALLL